MHPLAEDLQALQTLLIARATGRYGPTDDLPFTLHRKKLLDDFEVTELLPAWLKTHRTLEQFWLFIKPKYATYEDRKAFIYDQLGAAFDFLERQERYPADDMIMESLIRFDAEHVTAAWMKALERRTSDPEGAITIARTLLESVCKYILDQAGETDHESTPDLNRLYKKTSSLLNLSRAQHEEVVFKQILGGCTAVVEGLGSLRNKLSDAHGKGKAGVRPASRHAELAVNLSGSMALFLLATWEARSYS